MSDLLTVSDAAQYIRVSETAASAPLQALLNHCEAFVQDFCGLKFSETTITDEAQNGALNYIEPEWHPLVSVTSIVDRYKSPAETLTADTDYTVNGGRIYYGNPQTCRRWPHGSLRYAVTYVAGYTGATGDRPAPEGIKLPILMMVKRIWSNAEGKGFENVAGAIQSNWPEIMQSDIVALLRQYQQGWSL